MVGPHHPADARRRQAHLGEGAHHDDILMRADQIKPHRIVSGRHIFGIGTVDDEQDIGAETGMQPRHLVCIEIGAGGIVGIGQPDHLGAGRYRRQQRIDIGAIVTLVDHDNLGAGRPGDDRIDRKTVAVHHRFVAFPQIDLGQQVQEIIRAIAADDAIGIDAMHFAQRLAQQARRALGIDFELFGSGGKGGDRLRAGAERGFIGRELDRIAARLAGLARHIGRNIENTGLRCGADGFGHDGLRERAGKAARTIVKPRPKGKASMRCGPSPPTGPAGAHSARRACAGEWRETPPCGHARRSPRSLPARTGARSARKSGWI